MLFLIISKVLQRDIPYKKYFYILLGAFAIGSPYIISSLRSAKLPDAAATLARIGLIHTHFPSGFENVLLCLCVFFIFLWCIYKKEVPLDEVSVLLMSGVVGGAIVVNQHIITGSNLEFSSHYWMETVAWCMFTLLYLSVPYIKKLAHTQKSVLHILLWGICYVIILALGVRSMQSIALAQTSYSQGDVKSQEYAPILTWLNNHTQVDDVIYADDNLSYEVPIYTSDNVYYTPESNLFFMSDQEVDQRFIIEHYFDDFIPAYIRAHEREIYGAYLIDRYNHTVSENTVRNYIGFSPVPNVLVPEADVTDIQSQAATLHAEGFQKALSTYRADYVIWDTLSEPSWDINTFKFLTPVYETQGIVIYRVSTTSPHS